MMISAINSLLHRFFGKCSLIDQYSKETTELQEICKNGSGEGVLTGMAGGKASCKVTFGTETVEPKVSFDVGRDNDTLRLSTKLEFSEAFKLRMKLYDRQRHGTEKWLRRARNDAPDEMTREILEGIVRQIDTDEEWHDWLQWNWRGSQRAVRNRIDEIRKEYRSVLTALKE